MCLPPTPGSDLRAWIRDVASIATTYLHAIAFGLPAALAARAFVALNAAVSRPKITMMINVFALALKVPLNAVFMFGAGPIPAMGGAGAGVATAVLAWLMLALNFGVWRFDPFFRRFHSDALHMARWESQRELLKLGIPIGLSVLFEVTSFTFMAVLIARLGTASVAGHQVVANMAAILFMVPLAIGIATSVLVAQSLGAGASARCPRRGSAGISLIDRHRAGGRRCWSGCCVSRSWRCTRSTPQSARSRSL